MTEPVTPTKVLTRESRNDSGCRRSWWVGTDRPTFQQRAQAEQARLRQVNADLGWLDKQRTKR